MGIGLGFRCTSALRDRDSSGVWPRALALKRIARINRQQVPRLIHDLDVLLLLLRTTTADGDQAKGKPGRPLTGATADAVSKKGPPPLCNPRCNLRSHCRCGVQKEPACNPRCNPVTQNYNSLVGLGRLFDRDHPRTGLINSNSYLARLFLSYVAVRRPPT